MPAASAFLSDGISASGVTRVLAMPSTFEFTAASMRVACLVASGSAE